MPFKHNAARRHRIPRARYRVTNWPAYEAGRRRGDLTLWLDEAALAGWAAPKRSTLGGQPVYSDLAIECTDAARAQAARGRGRRHWRDRGAHGIAQQLDRLQERALAQGWTVADEDVFRDDGYSGANLKRPGLERLRDRVALRVLDRVLITAPDRLARHYVHQVLLLEEITATGCQVEFLDRPMSQDPHDQLLLQIRGAVAEYERSLIAERMRRGRLRKLQAGLLLPWTRPPCKPRSDAACSALPASCSVTRSCPRVPGGAGT